MTFETDSKKLGEFSRILPNKSKLRYEHARRGRFLASAGQQVFPTP